MFDFVKKLFVDKEESEKNSPKLPAQAEGPRLSVDDLERCMLQQTTSYRRGCPIILATNKENELFLIHYYPNTFYIFKVVYENDKLNVVYDYRRRNPVFEGFQYRIDQDSATATLKLRNAQVEFIVRPETNYHGSGCSAVGDQTPLYNQFVSYLDTYRENINSTVAMMRKETSYLELLQAARQISDDDKQKIFALLDKGDDLEAIRQIRDQTGLGLADCKKIADSPYMYL